MEERGFLLLIAVSIAFLVGLWGSQRKIGFWWAFSISLVNAVIGIIVVACSKKLTNEKEDSKK